MRRHPALRSAELSELEELINRGGFLERRRLAYASRGERLNAHLTHYALNQVQLVGVHLGARVEATSVPLHATQILIPLHGRIFDHSRVKDVLAVGSGSAAVHNARRPVRIVWEPDSCCLSVRIPEATMQRVFHAFCGDFLPGNFMFYPSLNLSRGGGRSLENIVASILREVEDTRDLILDPQVTRLWEELLVLAFLRTQPQLARTGTPGDCSSAGLVYPYVRRSIDFMMANLANHITIDDLVRSAGVPLRTLQNGFNQCFGTGPMTYLRRKRLTEVSIELATAAPQDTSVGDVAAKWGFYNASQFALQYRRLFGELPSETLRSMDEKPPRARI